MAASHSAVLAGNFFRVTPDFMLLCLAKADDVQFIAPLRVGHVHDGALKPSKQIDPLLAIGFAGIFPGNNRMIEDGFAACKVKPVDIDIAKALRLIPSRHTLIVFTNK